MSVKKLFEKFELILDTWGVIINEEEHAKRYVEAKFNHTSMGVFYDKHDNPLGINTRIHENVYSYDNLLEYLVPLTKNEETSPEHEWLLDWWNERIQNLKHDKKNNESMLLGDMEVPLNKLKNHFIETVTTEDTLPRTIWKSYYINPPLPVELQLPQTKVSFSENDIREIMVVETPDEAYRSIYFYDKSMGWVESIEVSTTHDDKDIIFLFDRDEYNISATRNNGEMQAYVELQEKLNIYEGADKTREFIKSWIDKNEEILKIKD